MSCVDAGFIPFFGGILGGVAIGLILKAQPPRARSRNELIEDMDKISVAAEMLDKLAGKKPKEKDSISSIGLEEAMKEPCFCPRTAYYYALWVKIMAFFVWLLFPAKYKYMLWKVRRHIDVRKNKNLNNESAERLQKLLDDGWKRV